MRNGVRQNKQANWARIKNHYCSRHERWGFVRCGAWVIIIYGCRSAAAKTVISSIAISTVFAKRHPYYVLVATTCKKFPPSRNLLARKHTKWGSRKCRKVTPLPITRGGVGGDLGPIDAYGATKSMPQVNVSRYFLTWYQQVIGFSTGTSQPAGMAKCCWFLNHSGWCPKPSFGGCDAVHSVDCARIFTLWSLMLRQNSGLGTNFETPSASYRMAYRPVYTEAQMGCQDLLYMEGTTVKARCQKLLYWSRISLRLLLA